VSEKDGTHTRTLSQCFECRFLEFDNTPPPVVSSATHHEVWLLGNLARATYVGSSDYVWPFSYNGCDNNNRVSQEINACSKVGHYGMHPGRGRGAPEIDILEAMGGEPGPLPNTHVQRPYFSSSLQVAPGVKHDRPILGHLPKRVNRCSFYTSLNAEQHNFSFFRLHRELSMTALFLATFQNE